MNIDKDLIGKPPNVAIVINERMITANDNLPAKSDISADGYVRNDTEMIYSREQLEADVYEGFSDVALSEQMRDILRSRVHVWLDRQAAITRAEVFEDGEYDCLTCDAKVELCGEIDRLTTERDALKITIDAQKEVIDRLKRENDELKDRNHELGSALEHMDALLVQKQHVIDIQRESFKKLEYEITVLKKKGAM